MDKNSVIGLVLIAAILIGFGIWNSPSQEQIQEARRIKDSTEVAMQSQERARAEAQELQPDALPEQMLPAEVRDSIEQLKIAEEYGVFADAAIGENKYFIFENELIKLNIATLGGRVASVELKDYQTYDGKPLILFEEEASNFGFNFSAANRFVSTQNLYFDPLNQPRKVTGADSATFTLRMNAGPNRYVDFAYGLKGNSYLVDFDVTLQGFSDIIAPQTKSLNLYWDMITPDQEKSMENQEMNTTMYYGTVDEDHDYLSETKDVKETLDANARWVGFKQQFFSSVIIAENIHFESGQTIIESTMVPDSLNHVKHLSASLSLPFTHRSTENYEMKFYFGPNHYSTLRQVGYNLHNIVPLGWGLFGWVNRFIVIPVFSFLAGFDMNYGIVILILTIIIKLLLAPFTYKAYLSTAKMRVLKPEIDELNKKHSKDEPLKKQQAVMSLYKKAGVSPLGGCLPMLLQFPILIAMFRFFPASIELRQESFLWAEDLSTYDSIASLPFHIPFYGDHVSLFTILMTVSTIIYTRMNTQLSASPEMAQMKWMMYLMPIVFLGIFNNYASRLSYYYFLANVITFGQQFLMQKLVDEKALLAKIEEFKKRPDSGKKSAFQRRIEEAAKKKGYKLPK
ncbi:MAG: membrane protein insertase YidC [Bacteroidetes bacterium]|nr:membrane protein insertase YidC [Bacteroidota bacterium]